MRIEQWLLGGVTGVLLLSPGDTGSAPASMPAVCFAPGTDRAYVNRVYADLQPGGPDAPVVSVFQFNPGARWTQTANASGLGQGAPTPAHLERPGRRHVNIPSAFSGDPSGPSNLRARLNSIYGSQATWQPIIQQAFDEWASRTGTTTCS